MAKLREIIDLCKAGQIQEAYQLAKADLDAVPTDPWNHRKLAWVLNYLMKEDAETGNYLDLIAHLDELKTLDQLSIPQDNILFDNILFKIGSFVNKHAAPTDIDTPAKLSTFFLKLRDYSFEPSKGYSFLLQSFIKCSGWQEMADFLDWWNLDNLTVEDYTPFKMNNGKTIMSLAERAFIAKSKALLRLNDLGRIEEFLPEMDTLMEKHPEMTYPGYFYGKLLLSLGSNADEALKVIVPFARKKATEFWVWQLLSDVFVNEPDKQLACLLRAVHCHTQESFLGKVRIKLAQFYIQQNRQDLAKYQIDKITQCYLSQGWHLPGEVDRWVHEPWINNVVSSNQDPVNYQAITDAILCEGSEEAIAIVTHVDQNTHRATLIYGMKKRMTQKLRIKIAPGAVLKINYILDSGGNPRVLSAGKTQFSSNLDFAKVVDGLVMKRDEWAFAFLHYNNEKAFISPNTLKKYNVSDGELVKALVVFDFNPKKDKWDWTCVSINKNKQ